VTWGNGATGITGVVSATNSLVGSSIRDKVGYGGVTALINGNYVVASITWSGKGAATWGNGFTGITGTISSSNSLIGSSLNDNVGSSITALTNGNYVVSSYGWNGNRGAATWGNGATGITGTISSSNSLVGSNASDFVGIGGVTALTNGNYVVDSYAWSGGPLNGKGAVTWGNGAIGITGTISGSNSLIGSTAGDVVGVGSILGFGGITALTNGNYVVDSYDWNGNRGAATWGNGATGITGIVSSSNSLVGSNAGDSVGIKGITALTNGNYVVDSYNWNNTDGAVTWGNGMTGITGTISSANSLIGDSGAGDLVGFRGVTALANGNYVVDSKFWNGDVGAVTWGNGATGVTGTISSSNSLVGSNAEDEVGGNGVIALTNGNYVVASSQWNSYAGAVTWGSGLTGITGTVSSANSLVGSTTGTSTTGDQVGVGGITALTNGNYVVDSKYWSGGSTNGLGAVTWGNGVFGTTGTVSSGNSMVGTHSGDRIGFGGIVTTNSGGFVVGSSLYNSGAGRLDLFVPTSYGNYIQLVDPNTSTAYGDNGTITALSNFNIVVADPYAGIGGSQSGAVYLFNGTTGALISTLVGSSAGDTVGSGGITVLTGSSNFVIVSTNWSNGTASNAGAITWGSGTTGVSGAISSNNSLVGTTANDTLGDWGVTALTNGNYVVASSEWNGSFGAATWGNGTTGVSGTISSANSELVQKAELTASQATDH